MASSDPIAGIGTHFGLSDGTVPGTIVDVSTYLDSVEPSSDVDELDGTTFKATSKRIIPGFETMSYSLSGKWSPDAHTFFRGIKGRSNISYEYGPEGDGTGMVRIYGTCSCKSYSGPVSGVDDVTTFTVELAIDSETDGTFPVVLREGETRGRTREEEEAARREAGRR